MTTKRTHGPCTCAKAAIPSLEGHQSDCPSLYPAQQEPDALTRLVRLVKTAWMLTPNATNRISADEFEETALSLISEAREEQRKARNEGLGLGHGARIAHDVARKANGYPERQKAALDIAVLILEAKE